MHLTPPRFILVTGHPGSGKTSVIRRLQEFIANHAPAVSVSTFEASQVLSDGQIPEVDRLRIQQGDLADPKVADPLLIDELTRRSDDSQCLLICGYPRRHGQYRSLIDLIKQLEITTVPVIFLDVPPASCVERLIRRVICPHCQRVDTKQSITCAQCGQPLEKRSDDDETLKIRHRLELSKAYQAVQMVFYSRDKHFVIHPVDGLLSQEEVFTQIRRHLGWHEYD